MGQSPSGFMLRCPSHTVNSSQLLMLLANLLCAGGANKWLFSYYKWKAFQAVTWDSVCRHGSPVSLILDGVESCSKDSNTLEGDLDSPPSFGNDCVYEGMSMNLTRTRKRAAVQADWISQLQLSSLIQYRTRAVIGRIFHFYSTHQLQVSPSFHKRAFLFL